MGSRIVYEALRLLVPYDVVGVAKRRIGGVGDGGYVLLDALNPEQVVMSFGIGPSVTFDFALAEEGHFILMFDHTIDELPGAHPHFTWFRNGVSAVSGADEALFSLQDHMTKLPGDAVDPLLKMDVEGAEWDTLAATPRACLARFAQITLELHNLLDLDKPDFNARAQAALKALALDFVPIHVHGNNFGTIGQAGGFAVVETLEVTYARRDLFETVASTTIYPTEHDTPNFDERPDLQLWFFPFLPGSAQLELA
jgi:hypothetical protein